MLRRRWSRCLNKVISQSRPTSSHLQLTPFIPASESGLITTMKGLILSTLLGLAATSTAAVGWPAAEGKAIKYTTVKGFFQQDEPGTDPSTYDYVSRPYTRASGLLSAGLLLTSRVDGAKLWTAQRHLPHGREVRSAWRENAVGAVCAVRAVPQPPMQQKGRQGAVQAAGDGPPRRGLPQRGRDLLRHASMEREHHPMGSMPKRTLTGGSATGRSWTATGR
jgi:hypothetical protein